MAETLELVLDEVRVPLSREAMLARIEETRAMLDAHDDDECRVRPLRCRRCG